MGKEKKNSVQIRLSRIRGQVAGVEKMIAEDRYCVEILHQIAAIRSALDRLGLELLTSHLENCVLGKNPHECSQSMSREELVTEMRHTLGQFLKSS